MKDIRTKVSYLVDTGADTCVYPRSNIRGHTNETEYELIAANGARIVTYGTVTVSLNLALCRAFKWLLVDPRNKQLIDTTTRLPTKGYAATTDVASIKTVTGDSPYLKLLAEFPDHTRPPVFRRSAIRHGVQHYITTTPGPPVHTKPRHLAPD